MAAHKVKCKYCQTIFDTNKEPYIYIESSRRYAHKECAEKYENNKTQDEKDYELLEEYIKHLFGKSYLTAKVKKQIKDFKKEYNYTFSGIHKTLIWWYEIKKNDLEKSAGGIGIVPYIYDDAKRFFLDKQRVARCANDMQEDKVICVGKNKNVALMKYKLRRSKDE